MANFVLNRPQQLAKILGVSIEVLTDTSENMRSHCKRLLLSDPRFPDKAPRIVRSMSKSLRSIQYRLYNRILLPTLPPSVYSYGGVPGRHIKTNAAQHLQSRFALTLDISNFYPTISHKRVYRLFAKDIGWHPDVARLITKLCTCDYHLALGLVTSPVIANAILRKIDSRIGQMCLNLGLVYTRYVDDVTISGNFALDSESNVAETVTTIFLEHGFCIKPSKTAAGRIADVPITKLRVISGKKIDVSREYLSNLKSLLTIAREFAEGKEIECQYQTRDQIWGRVQFVRWINRRHLLELSRMFSAVPWGAYARRARSMGLVKLEPVLRPLPN